MESQNLRDVPLYRKIHFAPPHKTIKGLSTPHPSSLISVHLRLSQLKKPSRKSRLLLAWIAISKPSQNLRDVLRNTSLTTHYLSLILHLPNYQSPISNYHLPISNYHLPISNHQLPLTNYQPPPNRSRSSQTPPANTSPPLLRAGQHTYPASLRARYKCIHTLHPIVMM